MQETALRRAGLVPVFDRCDMPAAMADESSLHRVVTETLLRLSSPLGFGHARHLDGAFKTSN